MTNRTQCLFVLILFCLVDMVIPVPILGLILIHTIIQKPPWFRQIVEVIYGPISPDSP